VQTPLTKFNKKVSPSLALPYWQGHDTADIEVFRAALLFAKITQKPRPSIINFGHHIKEEGFNVIEQRLVIKEHFRQQAQVLAVDLAEYR